VIRINLLPKEERSRRRSLPTVRIPKIGGMVPFAVLGVVFGLVGTIATTQSQQVKRLKADIESARAEAERYKPQLERIQQITQKRQDVRARLDIIANLDRQRYLRVQLLDELSGSMPENMWLGNVVELDNNKVQIDGVTFSNFNVARFMDQLEATEHWQNVDLSVAQKGTIEDTDVVQFSLTTETRP
jgi:type IV pilus assembly protein PilN